MLPNDSIKIKWFKHTQDHHHTNRRITFVNKSHESNIIRSWKCFTVYWLIHSHSKLCCNMLRFQAIQSLKLHAVRTHGFS
jgi:hypothetical protein